MAIAQPSFRTRRAFFRWYSGVYLKCHHWRNVVRPAAWKYRKGMCCFCGKAISGAYHCHHGEGMYSHLGEEERHLERMFVAHPKCHERHTKKERRKRPVKALRRVLGI